METDAGCDPDIYANSAIPTFIVMSMHQCFEKVLYKNSVGLNLRNGILILSATMTVC